MASNKPDPPLHCRICGRELRKWASPYRVVVLELDDIEDLINLVATEGCDSCPFCGARLAYGPTIVLRSPELLGANTFEVAYGRHYHRALLKSQLRAMFNQTPIRIRRRETCADVIRCLIKAALPELSLLREFFDAALLSRQDDWCDANNQRPWAALLTVAKAAVDHTLPGAEKIAEAIFGAKIPATIARDPVIEILGNVQRSLLSRICYGESTELLEVQVLRLVSRHAAFPIAVSSLRAAIAKSEDHPAIIQYKLLAVDAIVSQVAAVPHDEFDFRWAEFYVSFELALAGARSSSRKNMSRLQLTPDLAASTLSYKGLWDAVARRLTKTETDENEKVRLAFDSVDLLYEILDRVDYGEIVFDFLSNGVRPRMSRISVVEILEHLWLNPPTADAAGDEEFAGRCRMAFRGLLEAQRVADAQLLLDGVLAKLAHLRETAALTLIRYGQACKDALHPDLYLHRAGERPSQEEASMPDRLAFGIGLERSNALRLKGRTVEALWELNRIRPLASEMNLEVVRHNEAILLRTTGRPDRSVTILQELLATAVGPRRLRLLESLATSYGELGEWELRRAAQQQAAQLSGGPWASPEAQVVVALSADDGVPFLDKLISLGVPTNPEALLSVASQWANRLLRDQQSGDMVPNGLTDSLETTFHEYATAGNVMYCINTLRLIGHIQDVLNPGRAAEAWHEEVRLRREVGAPDPVALAGAARHAILAHDEPTAASLLAEVPTAQATVRGGIATVDVAIGSTGILQKVLQEVAVQCVDSLRSGRCDWSMLRLVAELQRDSLGRAKMITEHQRQNETVLSGHLDPQGLADSKLKILAPAVGSVEIIEWIDFPQTYAGILTSISATGVTSRFLSAPKEVSLRQTAEKLKERLNAWRPGQKGSPLALEPWEAIKAWIEAELSGINSDGHVIFIDHDEHLGLPWHAVEAPWSVSYANSWASLLTLAASRAVQPPYTSIGLVVVPGAEDSNDTHAALAELELNLRELTNKLGLNLLLAVGRKADRAAVSAILSACDVAIVVCHGFVSSTENEVALMLSCEGELPTTHTVSANSANGRKHRWSWRDAAELARAPRLVLSAACSTGTSHSGGLGERLGLFGALRFRGTRSVIAPMWDAVPGDACQVLTSILRVHLQYGKPLHASIEQAAEELHSDGTAWWRTRCFGLEGDWR